MNSTEPAPSPWAIRFLRTICPDDLFEEIEGDLIQKFHKDLKVLGPKRARRRSLVNSLLFFRPGILLRNKIQLNRSGSRKINIAPIRLDFRTANDLSGWIVFSIALVVFVMTTEKTASYWDCTEFIATSFKLEVPHPPGAPLFLLLGRLFSFLALGDVTKVAYAINIMSALASAFTILFLFWSIVLFGRKLLIASGKDLEEGKWLLMGAGAVGALAYGFSDSFWFSAVEAEVYALSSLFTAFVVWGIMKWDLIENASRSGRWLLLIAFVIGLSIGVHLLNLLTLPALGLIYYFKTFKTSAWGIIITLMSSLAFLLFINDLIVPGLPTVAGYFELFFVNTLGLFFGSGVIVFTLILISSLACGIRYTHVRRHGNANTFILAITFILVGYCSYALIIIRSNFDPPINESAPKDVMSVVRYLKREQYGSRPLLFGPYFTSNPVGYKFGASSYVKGRKKYEPGERKYEVEYLPGEETLLPRAWDSEFKEDYKQILGLAEGQKPTFGQNLYYLFKHQIGTMYMRYFMWNFAGRTGDQQGADWFRPADWFKKIPSSLALNKARNNFFMIPFVLGLVGMFYHFLKDSKNFAVILLLFFMLGAAIVLYLNSPPTEPRERDYIYVGSYYAFAFWIGLSVVAIAEALMKFIRTRKAVVVVASMAGMMAPLLMISEGWDDHDRSNRFFSVDAATNSLVSCDADGIVFTGGDNDTFPLWYAQETEGCRTDLRVLVLSYCGTDWYIDQTTRKAYESSPFHYSLKPEDYKQNGPNNYLPYADLNIKSIDINEYLGLLAKNYPPLRDNGRNILPSKVITLKIDKEAVLAKGIVPKEMERLIVDQMELKVLRDGLEKKDLVFLDLLATNDWERPIYLNPTSLSQMSIDLKPYAVQEGNTFRILPVKNPNPGRDYLINVPKTFDLMVNRFKYRNLDRKDVYYTSDYEIQILNHRNNLNSLAEALIDEGDLEKASQVLRFSLEKMPDEAVPYDPSAPDTVSLLFKAGQKKKAIEISSLIANRAFEVASYLIAEGDRVSFELRKNLFMLAGMQRALYENKEEALAMNFEQAYERLIAELNNTNVR